jgi:hypothetical protein
MAVLLCRKKVLTYFNTLRYFPSSRLALEQALSFDHHPFGA